MSNGAERMRRELMIRLVKMFKDGTLEKDIDQIPILIRPKHDTSSRCCIYHDRAVLKYRLMALLGIDLRDETDETKPLSAYLKEAKAAPKRPDPPLTVCSAGCAGCPEAQINVTTNCRGCFARPCTFTCPKKAITVENHHAVVDQSKCIKCGRCLQVCPFNAIIKTKVPCEDVCPVGAIHKNEFGVAEIDFEKCISCGKCMAKCPFGAVMEKSELFTVLNDMAEGKKLIALVAPSAQFQFPGGVEKLFTAIVKAGFSDVIEVALGAEMTTANEAEEFIERMRSGEKLMTTSCCTAYVELVNRHVPMLKDKVSNTPSPMRYAGDIARKKDPEALTVFIGPCVAKRYEAYRSKNIDRVLTFEELGALLAGSGIDIMSQEPMKLDHPATSEARNFAKSCGVTEAVLTELLGDNSDLKLDSKFINGIDRKTAGMLKLYALGKLPGNFLEVMSCPGGCVGGPCSLVK